MTKFVRLCTETYYISLIPIEKRKPNEPYFCPEVSDDGAEYEFSLINLDDISTLEYHYDDSIHIYLKSQPMKYYKVAPNLEDPGQIEFLKRKGIWKEGEEKPDWELYMKAILAGEEGL